MDTKLILHFDARNTLFVADFKSKLTMEKALNTYFSGLAWGKETNGEWCLRHENISTNRPEAGLTSYYKFMERKIVKEPTDRPTLRQILGRFTQENGSQFEHIFLDHLKRLEWLPEWPEIPELTVRGDNQKFYHYLLPAFFTLLKQLHDHKRHFAVIIRTYGEDLRFILRAIQQFVDGRHPLFRQKFAFTINNNFRNTLRITETSRYEYQFSASQPKWEEAAVNSEPILPPDIVLHTEHDIVRHWNSICGVAGVQDDFTYWLNEAYHYRASKPLWINADSVEKTSSGGCHYLHIFVDDCIRPYDNDSIVHLRRLKAPNSNKSPPAEPISASVTVDGPLRSYHADSTILTPKETMELMDVHLVQADLLQCICNENYFWNKIMKCEHNFHRLNNGSHDNSDSC